MSIRSRLGLSAAGGLCAGVVALLLVLAVTGAASSDWRLLIPCALLATFTTTTVGFWLLLGLGSRLRAWMGVLAGLVIGVFTHAVTWYLALVAANLLGMRSSLGEPPVDLLNGLLAAWVYAAGSLLLVGWISLPLSAIVGGSFARIAARRMQTTHQPS